MTEQVLGDNIKDTVANLQNNSAINLVKKTLGTIFKDDLVKNLIEEQGRKFSAIFF